MTAQEALDIAIRAYPLDLVKRLDYMDEAMQDCLIASRIAHEAGNQEASEAAKARAFAWSDAADITRNGRTKETT